MSTKRNLNPGQCTVFSTRPTGMTTKLFAIPWPLDPNAAPPKISWHIELCCQPVHMEFGKGPPIDISSAAGALVTVKNEQASGATQVWTDY